MFLECGKRREKPEKPMSTWREHGVVPGVVQLLDRHRNICILSSVTSYQSWKSCLFWFQLVYFYSRAKKEIKTDQIMSQCVKGSLMIISKIKTASVRFVISKINKTSQKVEPVNNTYYEFVQYICNCVLLSIDIVLHVCFCMRRNSALWNW